MLCITPRILLCSEVTSLEEGTAVDSRIRKDLPSRLLRITMTPFSESIQNGENIMLEKIFDSSGSGPPRVRLLREGLHGGLLDSFCGELLHLRYANVTARRHLRSAEHFADWASHRGIALSQWNENLVERFGRHLRRRRCSFGHSGPVDQLTGASLFLKHLRTTSVISTLPA